MAWRFSYAHRLGEASAYGQSLSEEVAKIFFFSSTFLYAAETSRGLQEDRGDASRLLLIDGTLSLFSTIYSLDDIFSISAVTRCFSFLPFFEIMQLLFYENKAHMYGREQP